LSRMRGVAWSGHAGVRGRGTDRAKNKRCVSADRPYGSRARFDG
jgi:hypothetical protein